MEDIQFAKRQTAAERETVPVIVNYQLPKAVLRAEAHVD
jgi:hypothetical protein